MSMGGSGPCPVFLLAVLGMGEKVGLQEVGAEDGRGMLRHPPPVSLLRGFPDGYGTHGQV